LSDPSGAFDASSQLAIQQLLHRFNLAFDEGDAEGVAELFVDGGAVVSGNKVRDREAIKAWVADAAAREAHRHFTTNVFIQPVPGDPRRATAQACFLYVTFDDRGPAIQSFGTYSDELVEQEGRWLFLRRTNLRTEPKQ
jgi:uncharacterized protein (TIGR02246 family)